jgi:hypothetical protein
VYAVFVERLTWEEHEFLSNAKNEEVWIRTKQMVKEKAVPPRLRCSRPCYLMWLG